MGNAEEVEGLAATKDRLDELTRPRRELHDREVLRLEDALVVAHRAEEQPAGALDGPGVAIPRKPLGARLVGPITGRWAAVRIVLEPIFEADMLDCSYGFRPRRTMPCRCSLMNPGGGAAGWWRRTSPTA